MTDDDEEEESEVVVQQVLDGISLDHELSRNLTSNRLRHRRRQWRQEEAGQPGVTRTTCRLDIDQLRRGDDD